MTGFGLDGIEKLKEVLKDPVKALQLKEAIDVLERHLPSLFCGLNICQRRAFKAMYSKLPTTGDMPHVSLITPANGVGKTFMMVQDIIGWTKGSEFLHREVFPSEAISFYDSDPVQKLRDRGLLSLRLVCDAEDMKDGGSVYKTIQEWMPDAEFTAMDTTKCYRQIVVHHPYIQGIKTVIAVKTFNQEVRKHSGSNCHRIWVNEPMPQDIWGETVGRTRSKKGQFDGTIAIFATVLDQAPYVTDLVDEPRNVHIRGAVWENCVGEEVTDEMARAVLEKIGVRLEKSHDGVGYITYGVLTRKSIENMIAGWGASPEELDARMFGLFMHLEGRILKNLNPEVHLIPALQYLDVPANWPVIQVVDPHPRHPDVSVWLAITPAMRTVVIDEYPRYRNGGPYYEQIKFRSETIEQTCEAWRRIEAERGITNQVVARIGDPNRFLDPNPRNNKPLQYDYAQQGFFFTVDVVDDIMTGHNELQVATTYNRMLWEMYPDDPHNIPLMLICDNCVNVWRSATRYSWKEKRDYTSSLSEQVDHKYRARLIACDTRGCGSRVKFLTI